jgi:hypothetical protein
MRWQGSITLEKAKSVIFYSWQSDLDGQTNRWFIEHALKNAVKAIKKEDSLQVEPVLDRDTADVPGSPDITKTIFDKIRRTQVFICDVSIINQGANTRLTPNPNVVSEWGFAFGVLSEERIITVLNTAYGRQEDLPFDLRQRRAIGYYLPKKAETDGQSRSTARKDLENKLKLALLTILKSDTLQPEEKVVPLAEQALLAVKAGSPDQEARVRDYMVDLAKKIPLITPTNTSDELDEQLVQAINTSTEMVIEFGRLAKDIAEKKANKAAEAIYGGFADILNLYTTPPGEQRGDDPFVRDLAKFLGQELFVIFFSFLIQNKRWELIAKLLDQDLYARVHNFSHPEFVSYTSLCEPVALLFHRNDRLKFYARSLQANLLHERHSKSDLANLVPIEKFIEADYFLFLRDVLKPATPPDWIRWRAWSTVCMGQPARFLRESTRRDFAQQLALSLGLADIPTLRNRLNERRGALTEIWNYGFNSPWFDPNLERFDIRTIGSR